MRTLAGPLALVLVCLPAAGAAQGTVDPGGVTTVVATLAVPDSGAGDSVAYTVRMADGFDLFAAPTGTRSVHGRPLRVPLTFGAGAGVRAGEVEAGRVIAEWAGGARTATAFRVRVRTRYAIELRLGREVITSALDRPAEVSYYLRNEGNTVDTVAVAVRAPGAWHAEAVPNLLAIAPGETAAGTIQLLPPETTTSGTETVVIVEARGRGTRTRASVRHIGVSQQGWLGDLASVPSTIFVGSATGSGLGGVALQAAGQVRADTRIGLQVRHTDDPWVTPALRGGLTGPEFRLDVDHRSWRVALGDVYTGSDLFSGPSVHAQGIDAAWAGRERGVAVTVAMPSSGFSREDGHLVRGSGYIETASGRWTAVLSEIRRDAALLGGFGMRSLGLRYDVGGDRIGELSVQAGLMHVDSDAGASATGPAVEADYQRIGDSYSLLARLRHVPATVPGTAAAGDELLVSGTAGLTDGLSLLGWGFVTRSPLLGIDDPGHTSALATGVRYNIRGTGTQLQLTGHLRDSETPYLGRSATRRTVRAAIDAPVGLITVRLDGEWGREEWTDSVSGTDPYESARLSLHWSSGPDWAWAGLTYRNSGLADALALADVGGRIRLGGVEVEGGINADLKRSIEDGTSFWTAGRFPVTRSTDATLGVDYTPYFGTERWSLSIGVSRRFALPLPFRSQPAVRGIVFEDLDADGVRDPGEPALPGVTVRLGVLETRTDGEGEFRFEDAIEGSLRVDTRTLELGLMVPPDAYLPNSGAVAIPVVRTAALELIMFLDRDGDDVRDEAEEAAAGVVVSLMAEDGRTRHAAADAEGRVRISALSPGRYTLRVHPPGTRRTGGAPIESTLVVEPGATVQRTLPVAVRLREIRMPDTSRVRNP
ncbi:MAG: carboxypeptidase regulatory-like domain-containing protein [Candidatus Longimicrobiales bacterium M2_2A_002]